jgi:hypothetical protein
MTHGGAEASDSNSLYKVTTVRAPDSNYLYKVTTVRADLGELTALMDDLKVLETEGYYERAGEQPPLLMRHSQGDHWDLMLLSPASDGLPEQTSYQSKADFQHDFLATCDCDWKSVKESSKGADLFHIEMFQAASGLYDKLLEQRNMENNYLVATQRNANLVFETKFGSDVDMFTLGIYKDLQSFATDPNLSSEVFEKAATDAGFKARSDIGFYLRRFLVGHQDTLASQVK